MGAVADALVIGGGPAGCAAALGLARTGATVTLLERERAPAAKVCGEFLSVEACSVARSLGVDPPALGAAPIDRVRVSWRDTTVEARLPFRAASLSRAAFDEALLRAAQSAGVTIERGMRAVALSGRTVIAKRADAERAYDARAIVLASGKTEFAGLRRATAASQTALGFKMHLALPARALEALGSAVELVLLPGGYAGMQRIEGAATAFAVVVDRERYARLGSWQELVAYVECGAPRFARYLGGARECWPKPLAVSGVPYGYVYREGTQAANEALYRAGDQLAVIPSFTGDGLAIALVSGAQAARAIAAAAPAPDYHAAMRRRLRRPMAVAGLLSRAIATPLGRAAVVLPASVVPQLFTAVAALTRIDPA